jgi:hypothetical protein
MKGKYKKPADVYLHYSHHFISTVLLQHILALKGPFSGVRLIYFHSQINAMCTRCKIGSQSTFTCKVTINIKM